MKELLLTCPFTGVPFKAIQSSDDMVYFIHPLIGEQLTGIYDARTNTIAVSMKNFEYMETVSPKEAQEILNVTKQRISQIVASSIIPVKIVAGLPRFLRDDVLRYKETRCVGAPKKEN